MHTTNMGDDTPLHLATAHGHKEVDITIIMTMINTITITMINTITITSINTITKPSTWWPGAVDTGNPGMSAYGKTT